MSNEPPVAIQFANSRYAVRGRIQEGIGTVDDLSAWLHDHVGVHNVNIRNVDNAIRLRDAIRAVFEACVDGRPPEHESLTVINSVAAAAPYWPALSPSYEIEERTAGEALDAALATIARDAMNLLAGPLREDLRACRAPGCVKFFVKDHPRREWCCDHCGNRARAARHYHRHRAGQASRSASSR
jgi:predicted RNA-binding Zn ribbon-like protein